MVTVTIGVGWTDFAQVPIGGVSCPGCGRPLVELVDGDGRLGLHTVRPTRSAGGMVPAGPRRGKSNAGRQAQDAYCPAEGDALTRLLYRLADDLGMLRGPVRVAVAA